MRKKERKRRNKKSETKGEREKKEKDKGVGWVEMRAALCPWLPREERKLGGGRGKEGGWGRHKVMMEEEGEKQKVE